MSYRKLTETAMVLLCMISGIFILCILLTKEDFMSKIENTEQLYVSQEDTEIECVSFRVPHSESNSVKYTLIENVDYPQEDLAEDDEIVDSEQEVLMIESLELDPIILSPSINYTGRDVPSVTSDLVWSIMVDEYKWDPIVSAGILGNMMAEVGGQTLSLQHNLRTPGYYGLCMWSIKYFPVESDMTVEEQMSLLSDTIDMKIFEKVSTPEEAAYEFAVNYERCSSLSYSKRKENARIAFGVYGGANND